jgi:hypothetical protein
MEIWVGVVTVSLVAGTWALLRLCAGLGPRP